MACPHFYLISTVPVSELFVGGICYEKYFKKSLVIVLSSYVNDKLVRQESIFSVFYSID